MYMYNSAVSYTRLLNDSCDKMQNHAIVLMQQIATKFAHTRNNNFIKTIASDYSVA